MTELQFFALIRSAVCGEHTRFDLLTDEELTAVYSLAKRHDLTHLLGHSLEQAGSSGNGEIAQKFQKQTMQAVYRCARQQHELEMICQVLETAQMAHIPLKGAVIRNWYPEPWMRTSTDIDILVREENLDAAVSILMEKLNYQHKGTAAHDVSLFSQSGVHLELHFRLADENSAHGYREILSSVWDYASKVQDWSYQYEMAPEMFYFYHIAHMAKHFAGGTCGIRPFLDLWVINHKTQFDRQAGEALLKNGGLLTFARFAEQLSEHWFSGTEADAVTRQMADLVLNGAVHGTLASNVALKQAKKGSRLKFFFSKIFLPYSYIKYDYPVLQKHKWLLPVIEVWRWIRLVFSGRLRRSVDILRENAMIPAEERKSTAELLKRLEL